MMTRSHPLAIPGASSLQEQIAALEGKQAAFQKEMNRRGGSKRNLEEHIEKKQPKKPKGSPNKVGALSKFVDVKKRPGFALLGGVGNPRRMAVNLAEARKLLVDEFQYSKDKAENACIPVLCDQGKLGSSGQDAGYCLQPGKPGHETHSSEAHVAPTGFKKRVADLFTMKG